MIENLTVILDEAQISVGHGFVVFLRIGALVMVMPGFGERSVPVRVKLGLALAFTLVVAPAVPLDANLLSNGRPSPWVFLTEPTVGLALGIGLRLLVFALQTAGSIAAQATSLSQLLGAAAGEPMPAIGHILVMGGLALAMLAGLHVRAAQMLVLSYDLFPAGRFPAPDALSLWGVRGVARMFALAFTLSAPFVIVSLIYNLTLGVINRAMPQLMVAFVGAPVITLGGLILLFLAAPLLLTVWLESLHGFLANPTGDG